MAQTINLGKLRLDWRGDFNPSTAYVANDVVTYRQQQWVCTQPTQTASFVGNQTNYSLTVTSINPITLSTGTSIVSTAAGTTVTVASTAGLQTGNRFVVSGNAGGGLTATTYFVGNVLSATTLTLSTSYANAIAGTYITFTAYTFGSTSSGSALITGTTFVAYGSLAVGQVIAGSTTPLTVTNATGTGSIATLTFPQQSTGTPFASGSTIVVQGITPLGYNGSFVVITSTATTVTYANTTTLSMQSGSLGTVSSTANVTTITAVAAGNALGVYTLSSLVAIPTSNVSFTSIAPSIPSTTSTYWTSFTQLFNNNGQWTNGQTYAVGDTVVYNTPTSLLTVPTSISGNYNLSRTVTQAYYCIQAHTASLTSPVITPIDSAYWTPVARKGALGTQISPSSTQGGYNLGVYGNNNYQVLVLPNRGIAFDNSPNYYNGSTKNTTDSPTFGFVGYNGQAMSWGLDANGSGGIPAAAQTGGGQSAFALTALSFPFYDYWRSASNNGTGVHSTPDNNLPRIIQWEKSYDGNLVLMNSGEVFAWGSGGGSAIGAGDTSARAYPVRVGGLLSAVNANTTATGTTYSAGTILTAGHAFSNVRIKRISMSGGCGYAASNRHCMAIDENGNLWVWGSNNNGQLGVGFITGTNNNTNYSIPQQLPRTAFAVGGVGPGQSVVAIWACGSDVNGWSFAVTADGNLWAWGSNGSGQLGLNDTTTRYQPVQVTTAGAASTPFGGGAVGSVVKIQVTDNFTSSQTTNACSAILTSTGQVYIAGNNASGWAGSGTTNNPQWSPVGSGPGTVANSACADMWLYGSGGSYTTMMQRDKNTGLCYTCGYNGQGQLGATGLVTSNNSTATVSKINVGGSFYNLTNVKHIAFTAYNSYVSATCVLDNGMSFSIGNNFYGQCSTGYSGAGTNAGYGAISSAPNVPSFGGTNASEPNGIELVNSFAWQPLRSAPGMQGYIDNCMGFGGNADAYKWLVWVNKDGRLMLAGSSAAAAGGSTVNPFGQVYTAYSGNYYNAESMTIPLTD